ncbi:N-methyl-L-tryptophan oxidase, partial [archaeon]
MRTRFPIFQPQDDEIGVYETNAGYLNPELCIHAHIDMGMEYGAQVHCGEVMETYG